MAFEWIFLSTKCIQLNGDELGGTCVLSDVAAVRARQKIHSHCLTAACIQWSMSIAIQFYPISIYAQCVVCLHVIARPE